MRKNTKQSFEHVLQVLVYIGNKTPSYIHNAHVKSKLFIVTENILLNAS